MQLSGRSKEIINRGGKKFFPREVEEILYTHPTSCTRRWSACPTPGSASATVSASFPKPDRDLSLDEAVGFLRGQIADYKLPETIELFKEFPMTGTGKVRRHVLRDWVLARHSPPTAS